MNNPNIARGIDSNKHQLKKLMFFHFFLVIKFFFLITHFHLPFLNVLFLTSVHNIAPASGLFTSTLEFCIKFY